MQARHAGKLNRYNIVLDDLEKSAAEQIKSFCYQEKISAKIESDGVTKRFIVSIPNVNLDLIEKIEEILGNKKAGH